MKTIRTLIAIGFSLSPSLIAAQTWQTVDDFQPAARVSSEAFAITSDASGTLFSVGDTPDISGVARAVVRTSLDGVNWGIVDVAPEQTSTYYGVNRSVTGVIVAVGESNNPNREWLVRTSNNGQDWQSAPLFRITGGRGGSANGVCSDRLGNIFIVGDYLDSASKDHWITRRSSDSGGTWITVDDFTNGGLSAGAVSIASAPDGTLYAVGTIQVPKSKSTVPIWAVRKSSNAGNTWITVDSFSYDSNYQSSASSVCVDASGAVYVAGSGTTVLKGVGRCHWFVRKSVNGGTTWAIVDDYLPPGNSAAPNSICADANGQVYVAGRARLFSQNTWYDWVVRKSRVDGTGWTLSDDFVLNTTNQEAHGIAAAPGGIYATGAAIDGSQSSHWFTRRLVP